MSSAYDADVVGGLTQKLGGRGHHLVEERAVSIEKGLTTWVRV